MPSEDARSAAETRIEELLVHCYDPLIPLNIVDLGLLHTLSVEQAPDAPGAGIPGVAPRFKVTVELLSASDDEAAQTQLRAQVENLLAGLPEVWRSSVRILPQPVWSPAKISVAGRRILGLDQPSPFPILNNRLR